MKTLTLLISLFVVVNAFSAMKAVKYTGVDTKNVEWCFMNISEFNENTLTVTLNVRDFNIDKDLILTRTSSEFAEAIDSDSKITLSFDKFGNPDAYELTKGDKLLYKCVGLSRELP